MDEEEVPIFLLSIPLLTKSLFQKEAALVSLMPKTDKQMRQEKRKKDLARQERKKQVRVSVSYCSVASSTTEHLVVAQSIILCTTNYGREIRILAHE